jgi:hypothetical protein
VSTLPITVWEVSVAWSLVAHRLAVRLYQRFPLRAMLWDYISEVTPGSQESLLQGASESEVVFIRKELVKEFAGAVKDVTDVVTGEAGQILSQVAKQLVDGSQPERGDKLLEYWIGFLKMAGVSNADFLKIYRNERRLTAEVVKPAA